MHLSLRSGVSVDAGCCTGVSPRALSPVSDVASCFATQRSRNFSCPIGTLDFLRSSASKQIRASSDKKPIATTTSHVSTELFRDAAHTPPGPSSRRRLAAGRQP